MSGFSIDAASGALTPVGPAVAADEGSIYLAASPNGKFVYVANAETTSSSVSAYKVNAATGVLTPTMPAAFAITGDSQPFGITVDRTSSHVYTTNFNSISAFKIDPMTGALSDVPGTPVLLAKDILPQSLTLSANGQFLYMTGGATNNVYAFSINADGLPVTINKPVATGTFPIGIVAEPSGKFVYAVNWISDDVSRYTITPVTGALVPASANNFAWAWVWASGTGCGSVVEVSLCELPGLRQHRSACHRSDDRRAYAAADVFDQYQRGAARNRGRRFGDVRLLCLAVAEPG